MGVVIRKTGRRIAALFLVLTIILPVILCGCSSKGNGLPSKVTEDMPWYDVKHFDVKDDFDSDIYLYAEYQLLGIKDGKIFVKAYAELLDDDIELQQDREEFWLLTYDTEGKLLSKTMFLDLLKDQFPLEAGRTRYIRIANYDGECICIAFDDDDEDYNAVSHTVRYNPSDGTFIETESMEEQVFCESDYKYSIINGYSVKASQMLGAMGSSISITVTDPDGQIKVIDMSEEFPSMRLMICRFIFKRNDGEAFIGLGNGGLNTKYFSLDLSSKEITEVLEPQDFIEAAYYFDGRYIEGVGNVVPNNKGIDVIDLKNETVENYFDINNCNMNRYASSLIEVNDVTEDYIILSSRTSFDLESMLDGHLNVYILNKCDVNPHAGKDIIRIASYGELSYAMAEGIYRFNDTSDTHLLMIDERYDIRRQKAEGIGSQGSNTEMYYDQLIADIQNGTGPDMVFNLSGVDQLYNDDYLIDLSDVIGTQDLIDGVVEAVRTPDGKLYHMPLSFTPMGIITSKDKVPGETSGMTFEEYKNFVAEVCNGEDPIAETDLGFLAACSKFYGRDLDLDSEDFMTLAEFAKNDFSTTVKNVPEDEEEYITGVTDYKDAVYTGGMSFDFLLYQCNGSLKNKTLIGLPSAGGIGPRFMVGESIAITSASNNIDACKDVIRLLLSEDIQSLYGSVDANPVSRKGLENMIADAVWFYNDQTDRYLTYFTPEEVENNGRSIEYLDADETAEAYMAMIDSCSGLYSIDLVTQSIICEEMEAYLAGQKDLDQTVSIIKNRINTYRSEHS